MKHKWYNLPRFTAVLLILFATISLITLYANAPARVTSDIGNVTFFIEQTVHLCVSGHAFTCTNPDADDRTLTCTVPLEGKLLEMQLDTTQGIGSTISRCAARHGGSSVPCRGSYSMRYPAPVVIFEENLGISEDRFDQLRLSHWQDQLSEATWLRLASALIVMLALNVGALLWQFLSTREMKLQWRTAVTLVSSVAIFLVLQLSSTIILLFQGWID